MVLQRLKKKLNDTLLLAIDRQKWWICIVENQSPQNPIYGLVLFLHVLIFLPTLCATLFAYNKLMVHYGFLDLYLFNNVLLFC